MRLLGFHPVGPMPRRPAGGGIDGVGEQGTAIKVPAFPDVRGHHDVGDNHASQDRDTAGHREKAARTGQGLAGSKGGSDMAIGPVQLIVLGFNHPDFHGEVIAELERLREKDTVRVIDSLVVYKDADGELEVEHLSNLTEQEAIELGSKIGALIGLGVEGEEGAEAGAALGAEEAEADGIDVFSGAEEWDVLADIPNDSAAALILLEHHWAVPLRDAIARAGGFRVSDGFISPLDLVAIGMMSAEEAKELHAMETSGAASGGRQ